MLDLIRLFIFMQISYIFILKTINIYYKINQSIIALIPYISSYIF